MHMARLRNRMRMYWVECVAVVVNCEGVRVGVHAVKRTGSYKATYAAGAMYVLRDGEQLLGIPFTYSIRRVDTLDRTRPMCGN